MTNRSILDNSLWIFLEKATKLIVYFGLGVLLARYLGARDFGLYSLVSSVLVIGMAVSSVGLNGVLVKEFVKYRFSRVFYSAVIVRFIGSAIVSLATFLLLYSWILKTIDWRLSALVSLAITFSLVRVVDLFFESQLKSSIIAKYRVLGYISGALLKVTFLFSGFGYQALIVAHIAELFFIFVIGFYYLNKFESIILTVRKNSLLYSRSLLRKGMPLFYSSIIVIIYMKVDVFFINYYLDYSAVGVYSAASRLLEGLFLFPAIVLPSIFPKMVQLRRNNFTQYCALVQRTTYFLMASGLALSLIIYFSCEYLINFIYGPSYADAVFVLRIYSLAIPMVYFGEVLSKLIIIENILKLSIYRHSLGLAVNVLLNYLLIPYCGIKGAAIASVFGYIAATIIFTLLTKRMRIIVREAVLL